MSRTLTRDLCWCVFWGGYFSSSDLCLIAQSFAAAIFTHTIPQISHLSSASLACFVQEHVRWLFMCLLKLPSGTHFLFVGHDWTQSFTKATGCLPATLHSCVLRTAYTILSYARPHHCRVQLKHTSALLAAQSHVLAESYADILNSPFLTRLVFFQASGSENAAAGGSTDLEQAVVSRFSLI